MRLSTRCFIAHDAIFEGWVKGVGGEEEGRGGVGEKKNRQQRQ